jgi:hypothetical protein
MFHKPVKKRISHMTDAIIQKLIDIYKICKRMPWLIVSQYLRRKIKMKKLLQVIACSFLLFGGPAFAENYLVFSGGFMPDLGGLGRTITLDGLKSLNGNPAMTGADLGTGCNTAPDPVACKREVPGLYQTAIYSENTLNAMENNTAGIITVNDQSAMNGLVLNLMYESQKENTFWRAGVSYTRKIMGGETESSVFGIKWNDVHWDYSAVAVPVYFGIMTDSSAPSSFYGALGIMYYDAGFTVGGMNNGEIPTTLVGSLLGPIGTTSVYRADGTAAGGAILSEDAKFRTKGVGLGALIGAEKRLESGNKIFIELNHIFAGGMGNATTRDAGGMSHLTPFPSFPVVYAGTVLQLGFKKSL